MQVTQFTSRKFHPINHIYKREQLQVKGVQLREMFKNETCANIHMCYVWLISHECNSKTGQFHELFKNDLRGSMKFF